MAEVESKAVDSYSCCNLLNMLNKETVGFLLWLLLVGINREIGGREMLFITRGYAKHSNFENVDLLITCKDGRTNIAA